MHSQTIFKRKPKGKGLSRVMVLYIVVMMVFSLIPGGMIARRLMADGRYGHISARTTPHGNVEDRMHQLRQRFPGGPGSYFTASGRSCGYGSLPGTHTCNNCSLHSVMAAMGYDSHTRNQLTGAWTCVAFARYAFFYIFGVDTGSLTQPSAYVTRMNDLSQLRPGDFVVERNYAHSGIFSRREGDSIIILESNIQSTNRVAPYGARPRPASAISHFLRANNYDEINGNFRPGPPPDLPLAEIAAGAYFIGGGAYNYTLGWRVNDNPYHDYNRVVANMLEVWRIEPTGYEYIIHTGVPGRVLSAGHRAVQVRGFDDPEAIPRWRIFYAGEEEYVIALDESPNIVLTLMDSSEYDDYIHVELREFMGSGSQKWTFHNLGLQPPSGITTMGLPNVIVGQFYSQTLQAACAEPVSWVISSGSLPRGLSLDPVTGEIRGGILDYFGGGAVYDFTVKAFNAAGYTTADYSVSVMWPGALSAPIPEPEATAPLQLYDYDGPAYAPIFPAVSAYTSQDSYIRISATHESAYQGQYADVHVYLDENTGITMLYLNIAYDSSVLERVGVSAAYVMPLPAQPAATNPFILTFELADIFGVSTDTGRLATIRFRVRGNATPGTTYVTLSVNSAYVAENYEGHAAVNTSTANGLVNVYAAQVQNFQVNFNPNHGQLPSGFAGTQQHAQGSTINDLPTPTRSGYNFTGWYLNGQRANPPLTVNGNMTLYAGWTSTAVQASPTPTPSPNPSPSPSPNPSPSPSPSPNPSPSPSPAASPTPSPSPAPGSGDAARPNPTTNPINVSLMLLGAVTLAGITSVTITKLAKHQMVMANEYETNATRRKREDRIINFLDE